MGIRKILIAGTALCALTLFVAQPASATPSSGSVTHAASGCAGMTVKAPKAGTTVSAASMGMPAGTESFYAKAAASHAKWLTDLSCAQTGHVHTLKPAASSGASTQSGTRNSTYVSGNWSGYQINKTAQYVQGGWTVPTLVTPRPGYSSRGYYSSTWDGIGGGYNAGSGPLIQSGTAQQMDNTGRTYYYAWYEVVGGSGDTGGERSISLPVHPGDVVGAVSLWTPATGAEMGVCNFSTTNTCVQFSVASGAPGTSAEWIEEAPWMNGILPLADFQQVTFVNACWAPVYQTGAACLPIAGNGPASINLQQYVLGGYQTLASPEPLNAAGTGFIIDYNQPEQICKPPCP